MESEVKKNRADVSRLIRYVLIGNICVREAVLRFPRDVNDINIDAAYHALVHYEADEDLRRRDPVYKAEQDDYLEMIANTLEKGDSLPENIIANYAKYYKSANIPHQDNTKGIFKSFWKILNIG